CRKGLFEFVIQPAFDIRIGLLLRALASQRKPPAKTGFEALALVSRRARNPFPFSYEPDGLVTTAGWLHGSAGLWEALSSGSVGTHTFALPQRGASKRPLPLAVACGGVRRHTCCRRTYRAGARSLLRARRRSDKSSRRRKCAAWRNAPEFAP